MIAQRPGPTGLWVKHCPVQELLRCRDEAVFVAYKENTVLEL